MQPPHSLSEGIKRFHTQDIEVKALKGMKDKHKGFNLKFKFDQQGLKFTPGSFPQHNSFVK